MSEIYDVTAAEAEEQTESLAYIAEIIDEVEKVGNMGAGDVLRATNWNALAGAVANLAKLAAIRERQDLENLNRHYALVGHGHENQVALSWFDEKTRKYIESLGGTTPEIGAKVTKIEKEVKLMRRDMDKLQEEMRRLLLLFDNTREKINERDREVKRINDRVEGLKNVKADMTDLNTRFGQMGERVEKSLQFQESLVDASGDLIDMKKTLDRISQIEILKNNLKLADGSDVRMRDIEQDIRELKKALKDGAESGSGGKLTNEQLVEVMRKGETFSDPEIRSQIGAITDERTKTSFDEMRFKVDGAVESASAVEKLVGEQSAIVGAMSTRISAVETKAGQIPTIQANVTKLSKDLESNQTRIQSNTKSLQNLSALPGELNSLKDRMGKLENTKSVLDGVSNRVDGIAAEVDALSKNSMLRMDTMEKDVAGLSKLASGVAEVTAKTEQQTSSIEALQTRASLNESQLADIEPRVAEAQKAASSAIASATTANRNVKGLDPKLSELTKQINANQKSIASQQQITTDVTRQQTRISRQISTLETRTAETLTWRETATSNLKEINTKLKIRRSARNRL